MITLKSNELRPGNWVLEFGIPKKITAEIIAKMADIESRGKIVIDLTPMPITPTALVELLGFEPDNSENNNLVVLWQYDGWRSLMWLEPWMILIKSSSGGQRKAINLRQCKYIHEVQNLYHALAGEELCVVKQDVSPISSIRPKAYWLNHYMDFPPFKMTHP